MNWLRRILGLNEPRNVSTLRRHGEFLADLGGDDRTALDQFHMLLEDRKSAASTLDKEGWGRVQDRLLDDVALLHIAHEHGLVANVDWAASPDEVIEEFDLVLRKRHLPGLPDSFHQFASEIEQAPGGKHVGMLFPKLVSWAAEHGYCIINLNVGSDMYHFGLVPFPHFSKWAGSKLSKELTVEDASWQFKK